MSGVQKPMRLPPVRVLRVKNPNKQAERPCMQLMSSVLGTYSQPFFLLLAAVSGFAWEGTV